ncbi:DUF7547 family protein [Halorarius litoreus]|uniref:DUF7547 family protein n=1 Tax=Halorarius litoreus TaxID=2962676 RepID=UPI0020CF6716|nr:hypothetical protein [Halorarius litoreus]
MSDADELAPLLDELATTLDELRTELDDQRPRRLRDLLQFTEEYTIPAIIALLETNIRLLELTAGAIRLTDGRFGDRRRTSRGDVAADALERALDDLGGALRGDPTDPDARQLLEEARDLRREVQGRLQTERDDAASRRQDDESGYRVPVEAESDQEGRVDVEAELETIKRELGSSADETAGEAASDESTGESDGDDAPPGNEQHSGEN